MLGIGKRTRRAGRLRRHRIEKSEGTVIQPSISQTSDLHQIDPLSQQDQLYRGVFLVLVPRRSPVSQNTEPEVDSLRNPRLTPNGTICSATDPFYHETAKDDWCGSGSLSFRLVSLRADSKGVGTTLPPWIHRWNEVWFVMCLDLELYLVFRNVKLTVKKYSFRMINVG